MSRLIDADAFSVEMKKRQDKCSEWVKEAKGNYRYRALGAWSMLSEVKLTLDKMPTIDASDVKHGEWIPCSERLPEDDTLMLVNYIDNRPEAMDIWIGWHEMENVWYIDGEAHSKEYGNEVVAWMPLPEPWRGEER